ncbi:hypothetical protein GCM10018952_12480 [Streptosporangium vulgare]
MTTHGIPMSVHAHRRWSVTGHASRPELVTGQAPAPSARSRCPQRGLAVIEFRLGAKGHDALGYAVHVPHYLAQAEYPS